MLASSCGPGTVTKVSKLALKSSCYASLVAQMVKESACNVGDLGFDPWDQEIPLEKGMATRSSILPGKSHGQRSWRAPVHRVAKSWTLLSDFHFSSVHLLSRVRLCDPMNCSTPGLPIHHKLLESTQSHVH